MENINYEEKYLKNQARFGFTVLNKARRNQRVTDAIENYLQRFDITDLPATRKDFLKDEGLFYQFDSYGDALKEKLDLLISFYYNIKTTKGYYAYFEENKENKLVPLAFWYSKHRLCAIWNWRKSQIIRQKYYSFLELATDNHNRLLIKHYIPIHLVLTVPHKNGIFKGQSFYASELIKCFNTLRKTDEWKKYIYGGEYGVEVKKSKEHGLHIHIHSFLLQNPEFSINETRYYIVREFAKITENQSVTDYINDFEIKNQSSFFSNQKNIYDLFFKEIKRTEAIYTGINYESLYILREGKKDFIRPETATVKDYLAGVMECIKYHFKPDCLEVVKGGEIDVELVENILNNTKGKNLYNRFGAFRKEDELNFNKKSEDQNLETLDTEKQADLEIENEDTKTTVEKVESKIVNPFTQKLSLRSDYQIVVTSPKNLLYRDFESKIPFEQFLYVENDVVKVPNSMNLTLKEVIKLDVKGKLKEQISYKTDIDLYLSKSVHSMDNHIENFNKKSKTNSKCKKLQLLETSVEMHR